MVDTQSKSTLVRLLNHIGPTDEYDSPLWALRLAPAVACISLVLSETVWKSGFGHGLCVGLAAGQLAAVCILAFRLRSSTSRTLPRDSDFQQLHLTTGSR